MSVIYLDNNATTRPHREVVQAMLPYLTEQYGNASSLHHLGQRARHAVEEARRQVASLIGTKPRRIIFTSGGTESINLAVRGALAAAGPSPHLVTTAVEHAAVLALKDELARQGVEVAVVGVDSFGRIDPQHIADAITDRTALVSVMHANNETGVLFPIDQIARITSDRGVPLHVDAVQTVGKLPIDVETLGIDLLSMSAHKIHGPKGVGALYVGRGARVRPQLWGGHQERDLRPGTENVSGIVGFGTAADIAGESGLAEQTAVARLRDRLQDGICRTIPIAHPIGDPRNRLPNTAHICFESLASEAILLLLSENDICVSSGSACSSGAVEPSHVLRAMGVPERIAHGAVRFSLSRYTTEREIDEVIEKLPALIDRLLAVQQPPLDPATIR